MDSANGNVEMHFGNISVEVNSAGHGLFQQVSNGIKAGDQSVSGKQIWEATSFLANVHFDLERKMAKLCDPNDTTASSSPQPYTKTASPPHGQSPAQFRRTKPENWDSMSTNQKKVWRRYHKINK
jgi:hypothetical protein